MQPKIKILVSCAVATISSFLLYPYCIVYGMLGASLWSPLPRALASTGLGPEAFRFALSISDFFIWLVLALPTALLINWLKPKQLALYTALATLPFYLWLSARTGGLITDLSSIIVWLVVVPIAVVIVAMISSKVRSNNSFKPSPLRGLGPTDSASGGPA